MTERKLHQSFDREGHVIEVVAEADTLVRQLKTASVRLERPVGTTFTIRCDEGTYLRGDDTAPPPLSYLTSSIAF